jgi:hypothetical protein
VALTENTPTADRHGGMKLGSRGGGSNESYVRAKRHFVLLRERRIENKEMTRAFGMPYMYSIYIY